jgi:hypothetical protein
VSPDAAVLSQVVDRAVRRARLLVAAESAAIGVAVAAWSAAAGLVVAVLFAVWRARAASRRSVVRALERGTPGSRNLIVTADEIASGALAVRPAMRERVLADASVAARSVDVRAAFPSRPVARAAILASAAWLAAAAIGVWRQPPSRSTAIDSRTTPRTATAAAAAMRVTVDIAPPPYTGRRATSAVDPAHVEAVENSTLHLAIESAAARVQVESSRSTTTLTRTGGGLFEHRTVLEKSGFLVVTSDAGARRVMTVTVTPDALPEVRLVAPGRDLVYGGGNARVTFNATASDDYGLRALVLRYTKVSGSGEQFEFEDGEIPLALSKSSARDWSGSAARSVAELGLHEGDVLVYRAVAADARPGEGEASSDAFFIEISKLGVAAGDAFTLPEEETRYALSQQMLIVKTERLNQQRVSMTPEAVVEASQGLAVEQRMIRSELIFMLGGEIEDEEVEAEQSTELQEGRLANRGQRDLRTATVAMSRAEKLLTGADTVDALKAERAAVVALQRAFSRERYILRALATRSQLDLSRRLSGTPGQAIGWRRTVESRPASRRAAHLQSLLQGLGEAARARQGASDREARANLAVLAELAVRTDPESPALRQVAADLQQLADRWTASPDDIRALNAIAAKVAPEARRALADPPLMVEGAR